LHKRGLYGLRRDEWAVTQVDRCLDRLREAEYTEHVWTDTSSVRDIAERVAEASGLALAPNTDGPLRGRLRRAMVGLEHIRF